MSPRPPGSCVTYSATDCRLAFPPSLRHFFILATHKSTHFAELLENISTPGISAWDAASTGLEMATGPKGLDGVVLARGAGPAAGRGAGRQDTFPSDTKDRRQLGLVVAIVLHLVIATVFRQRIDDKDGHAPIAAGWRAFDQLGRLDLERRGLCRKAAAFQGHAEAKLVLPGERRLRFHCARASRSSRRSSLYVLSSGRSIHMYMNRSG